MGLGRRNVKKATVTQTSNLDHALDHDQIAIPAFFRLPPELRNLIYELALPRNEDYTAVRPSTLMGLDHWLPSATIRQLLATCTLIRAEALPVFYGTNTFVLALGVDRWNNQGEFCDTLRWVESIDPHGITRLAHLVFVLRFGWKGHSHLVKMQMDFVPSGSWQATWYDYSDVLDPCMSRARCAKELLQKYALMRDATMVEVSGEEAKAALLETLKGVHERLHLSWWDRNGVRTLEMLVVAFCLPGAFLCFVGGIMSYIRLLCFLCGWQTPWELDLRRQII
ncbi:hypothetical protein LTR56_003789 [Elasticomyces elasticus]|nr:hypothetical protein LTR22_013152 [Elasticomyces elasticus]KAK3654931.1 hypothetical protein LTR56_003789 [Elasticomyces elasticus]KAK4928739.1 hypothetical protein LTR49_004548 [Elasticomyces elasticus]KAK5766634.1 hypothetical protein LTS12_003253 [Elasticomyces elasticus]